MIQGMAGQGRDVLGPSLFLQNPWISPYMEGEKRLNGLRKEDTFYMKILLSVEGE